MRQTLLHNLAENVQQKLVRFLNPRGRLAFYEKIDIGHADSGATITPEQRDRFYFARFRFLESTNNVL